MILGPKEPKHDINTYLGPMVREFMELHTGVWFETSYGRHVLIALIHVCFPESEHHVLCRVASQHNTSVTSKIANDVVNAGDFENPRDIEC